MNTYDFKVYDKEDKEIYYNYQFLVKTRDLNLNNIFSNKNLIFLLSSWLKDDYWNTIYDGDILEYSNYWRTWVLAIVSFDLGSFWCNWSVLCNFLFEFSEKQLKDQNFKNIQKIKIIWNIHKNPELLNK